MKTISIAIPGEPSRSTHQAALRVIRTKSGRTFVGKYASSKAKGWASELARGMEPFKPQKPLEGPLCVSITWVFGHTKAEPKSKRGIYRWKTTRPDLDNMEKSVLDVLTQQGFMLDDSQVVFKTTKKMHGPNPCLLIEIVPLDSDDTLSPLQQ